MRCAALLLLALGLVSCKQELSFDERYDAAQKKMLKTADEIDAELEKAETPSPTVSPGPSEAPEAAQSAERAS